MELSHIRGMTSCTWLVSRELVIQCINHTSMLISTKGIPILYNCLVCFLQLQTRFLFLWYNCRIWFVLWRLDAALSRKLFTRVIWKWAKSIFLVFLFSFGLLGFTSLSFLLLFYLFFKEKGTYKALYIYSKYITTFLL